METQEIFHSPVVKQRAMDVLLDPRIKDQPMRKAFFTATEKINHLQKENNTLLTLLAAIVKEGGGAFHIQKKTMNAILPEDEMDVVDDGAEYVTILLKGSGLAL